MAVAPLAAMLASPEMMALFLPVLVAFLAQLLQLLLDLLTGLKQGTA